MESVAGFLGIDYAALEAETLKGASDEKCSNGLWMV
jgi:hypothetical protein